MVPKIQKVSGRGADGIEHPLVLVRRDSETAYCCSEHRYLDAIQHPEAWVGFPIEDVKMKEAAN